MALVVVRCPGCRGAARVAQPLLGSEVECPRCAAAFRAVEEATLVVPGAGWVPPNPPPPRQWSGPHSQNELEDDEDEYDEFDDSDEEGDEGEPPADDGQPEPDPDPHDIPASPTPASVFIGLALLPFLIPIIWLIASVTFARQPVLTVGTPLALAVCTSILCLAVISTIDWTPATRIKGVLLLVVLSYLTGLGLYLVKKDPLDRALKLFGKGHPVNHDAPAGAGYRVTVPGNPIDYKDSPHATLVPLACRQAMYTAGMQGTYKFVYGSSEDPKKPKPAPRKGGFKLFQKPERGTDAWFDAATDDLVAQAGGQLRGQPQQVKYRDEVAGREVVLQLQDKAVTRVVRLYVVGGRVYYLSVERAGLEPDDDIVKEFFDSFEVR